MKRQHDDATASKIEGMASQAKPLLKISRKQAAASHKPTSMRVKCSSAAKAFNALYLNERTADVFFTFEGSTERVPAHKAILSSRSTVFDQIFFGPSAVSGDIPIARHSPGAFKDFLQFFYLNEITLKTSTILEVIRLSQAHLLPAEYLEICSIDHYNCTNIDDVYFAYKLAILFRNKRIQTICEHEISINCGKIFKTDDFLSCSFYLLLFILGFDKLLCDESLVLRACLDWARYKCKQNGKDTDDLENVREHLVIKRDGRIVVNLLHKIRYGSISRDEFSIYVDQLDKLFPDASEREDVMLLLLGSKSLKSGKFSTEPRNVVNWNDEQATDCMFVEKDIYSILPVRKRFNQVLTTSQAILLGGFYIVPLISKAPDVAFICVNLSIVEQRNEVVGADNAASKLIHKECQKVPERMEKLCMQLKSNPIVMKPDCEYHIEIDLTLDHRTCYREDESSDYDPDDGADYASDFGTDCHDSDGTSDSDDCAVLISFYDEVEYEQEIKINKCLTIESHPKTPYGKLLIKGLKFAQ